MAFTTKATITTFGGRLLKLVHQSAVTGTEMAVNVFLPGAKAPSATKFPVLYYLSGLTCSPENCSEKGFVHAAAAKHGIAVVYPDTSPRGLDLPAEHDAYDFGSAASFYIDADAATPYGKNYRMETYITKELPALLFKEFADLDASRQSITGHSMGGHGALTLYLKNPGQYKSVSAFAPISNPTLCPWGQKAFKGYLGPADSDITPESAAADPSAVPAAWKAHDATELVKTWSGDLKMLIDVGTGDNFYVAKQLLPENFAQAVKDAGLAGLTLRYQDAYDHSYYFISSFSQDHVDHAAKHLFA
ncbi:s-formylglutathione hydrolase [Ophiostoma piceae UAMH 11346]|uniref:S-formylglutathione hydrolase n=1 Tax=Ophiostoma piceae (strain UAMH 11346) TaxID=1262450 RepID=S3BQ57_OPHP1|nr:s-formylglutathione hydrolase [Ophiostoma piceae UAMH 11346]